MADKNPLSEIDDVERRRAKYAVVSERLYEMYGRPTWRQWLPPLDDSPVS